MPGLMVMIHDCSFILSVEQGKLETQAVLLVESLRQFGGAYSNCPVYAVSPRSSRQMSAACRAKLSELGVQVIVEDLLAANESYGSVARLVSCVWAEKNLTSEILISLDDDLFFAGEPDFDLKGADFFARPVDLKGICPSGSDDPLDSYWRKIALLTGVDYEQIPYLETTVDCTLVKASYNGGMIAVRRQLGLFEEAESMFRILRKNDLSPYKIGDIQVFAAHGFVDAEGSRWWGSSQVILSLAATKLGAAITIAPKTYNVPIHLAEFADSKMLKGRITLNDAILIHYHWLLDKEYIKKDTFFYGSSALPEPVFEWLKRKTALNKSYSILDVLLQPFLRRGSKLHW
jgi:hypothetical protein